MTRQVGVGIVGTGIMATRHASSVVADPRSFVAGWVSRSRSQADVDAIAAAPLHRTVDAMLADPSVEVVIVATPDFAHREAAVASAEAGRHVLVEKPLATDVADAEAILAAVRDAGVHGMTLFNHRWIPAYWQARTLLAEDGAGEFVAAYARKNDTIDVPTSMIGWADQTTCAGFLSSHDIDLVTWFTDATPVEVYATAVSKRLASMGIDTPDAIHAQVRFESGAVATFESCWIVPATYPTIVESFIEVITTTRHVHIPRKIEQLEVATEDSFTYPRNLTGLQIGKRPSGSAFAAVQHFLDVVVEGDAPLLPLDHSVLVTRVLDAIDRSIRSGRPTSLTAP